MLEKNKKVDNRESPFSKFHRLASMILKVPKEEIQPDTKTDDSYSGNTNEDS